MANIRVGVARLEVPENLLSSGLVVGLKV